MTGTRFLNIHKKKPDDDEQFTGTFMQHPTRSTTMPVCARCGKKRNIFERLFALDDVYCDECLFDTDQEHRKKRVLPVRQRGKLTEERKP